MVLVKTSIGVTPKMNRIIYYNLQKKGVTLHKSTMENVIKEIEKGNAVWIGTIPQRKDFEKEIFENKENLKLTDEMKNELKSDCLDFLLDKNDKDVNRSDT